MKYHVRHANGQTVEWTDDLEKAVALARGLGAQCYAVDKSGRAVRIV